MKIILINPRFRKILSLGAVCAALGAIMPSALAQTTYTWTSASNTDFAVAGNWSPGGGPPGALDNVEFNANVIMALTDDRTINDFTMALGTSRSFRTGGTEDLARTFTIDGTLAKSGAGAMIFFSQNALRGLNLDINQVDVSNGILALGSNTSGSIQGVTIGSATLSGGTMQFIVNASAGTANITNDLGFTGAGTVWVRERSGTGAGQSGVLNVGSLTSTGGNGIIEVNNRTSSNSVAGLLSLNNAVGTSTYSGVLRNGGTVGNVLSVEKNSAGTQVLSGVNTYTGATTVNAGTLLVGAAGVGSLGNTAVAVNAGTLGGTGSAAGAVTVGNGAGGSDAFIAAGDGAGSIGTFTMTNSLSLASDATFVFEYNGTVPAADQLVANGVTIDGLSVFSFTDINPGTLTMGTQFVIINNTSGGAITGTFSNLADGGSFTSGANQFQASYSGGTGNDLVLTVVPEPSATVLLGAGLISVLFFRRRLK